MVRNFQYWLRKKKFTVPKDFTIDFSIRLFVPFIVRPFSFSWPPSEISRVIKSTKSWVWCVKLKLSFHRLKGIWVRNETIELYYANIWHTHFSRETYTKLVLSVLSLFLIAHSVRQSLGRIFLLKIGTKEVLIKRFVCRNLINNIILDNLSQPT